MEIDANGVVGVVDGVDVVVVVEVAVETAVVRREVDGFVMSDLLRVSINQLFRRSAIDSNGWYVYQFVDSVALRLKIRIDFFSQS